MDKEWEERGSFKERRREGSGCDERGMTGVRWRERRVREKMLESDRKIEEKREKMFDDWHSSLDSRWIGEPGTVHLRGWPALAACRGGAPIRRDVIVQASLDTHRWVTYITLALIVIEGLCKRHYWIEKIPEKKKKIFFWLPYFSISFHLLSITNVVVSPINLTCMALDWKEKVRAPGGNLCRHGENMHTTQKGPPPPLAGTQIRRRQRHMRVYLRVYPAKKRTFKSQDNIAFGHTGKPTEIAFT